jgi:RNA polymerase sigma-70 factor (ECF subfamily)
MAEASTTQVQNWIRQLNAGDEAARAALLAHAYERLRRLTHKLLQDFRRLERWEEADDVLQGALVRLLGALKAVPVASAAQFFRLATLQIRRELLDLARHYFGPEGPGAHHASVAPAGEGNSTAPPAYDAPQSTYDPGRLAAWAELHRRVEALPAGQRDVFELRWYQGLTVEETAAVLEVSEPTVKRRWAEARLELAAFLREGT